MVNLKIVFSVIVLFLGFTTTLPCLAYYSADSVGVTSKAGKTYIIHQVVAGETLYSISRRYTLSVQSIKDANDELTENLRPGQTIMIPTVANQSGTNGSRSHTVRTSETLYSISRQYSVSVSDLRKWNNLTDDNLAVGQKLIIQNSDMDISQNAAPSTSSTVQTAISGRRTHTVEPSQTLYAISRMYNVSTADLQSWNKLDGNSINIGQVLIVSAPGSQTTPSPESNSSMLPSSGSVENTVRESPKAQENEVKMNQPIAVDNTETIEEPGEKIVQKGMAELVKDPTDTKKYLALHRTAPIGTIMQVRNEMNGQTVFVRVVATIPPTGDNAKVILQISRKAYDRLGAVDNRFPVEISYLP